MKPLTENWIKIARYDLRAAKINLDNGINLKVFENCHSALEKLLKGLISENIETEPPKVHNLLKLASIALIQDVTSEIEKEFNELNQIYFLARYPDNFDYIQEFLSIEKTKGTYKRVEKIFNWLEEKLNESR